MSWELTILNYHGKPPRSYKELDDSKELPLGTFEEVRDHISHVLKGTEWITEPSLIEMMKANGSEQWKTWDEVMLEHASKPRINAYYAAGDLFLQMFGFHPEKPQRHILVEARGTENPIPTLNALCKPMGWSVFESHQDGEFIDLDNPASPQWNRWLAYLDYVMQEVQGLEEPDSNS